ncbi:MAG: protein-L-isoaspartate(D-aspartate) O-methyltransferase [Rhodospirillaceae bacterium]|nr:protein-L-isoaspartate(D-aspartate) O-methyltransferase [Rhodospirillaceae bacterium]
MSKNWRDAQQEMLRAIEKDMLETAALTGRRALSPAVHDALRAVPRHKFVRPEDIALAYKNRPLPIGHGQTISQPFIVALMSEFLDLPADAKTSANLLEIGAGCGYQSAVLAELAHDVAAIEIVTDIARASKRRLKRLGYSNVSIRIGDGALGWPERAPFDGIIVAAAAPKPPPALIAQLKPGAKLVIPIGPVGEAQDLTVIGKTARGKVTTEKILPVAFVPFTGGFC